MRVLIIVLLLIASCSNHVQHPGADLIGSWYNANSVYKPVITFKSNYLFSIVGTGFVNYGIWTVSEQDLTIDWEHDSATTVVVYQIKADTLYLNHTESAIEIFVKL